MKRIFTAFLSGFGFAAGAALCVLTVQMCIAQLSLGTGPSGTNPINAPEILPDYNVLVNNLNNKAVMNTTTTPPYVVLGFGQFSTGNFLGTGGSAVQPMPILKFATGTLTTATATTCFVPGADACFSFWDATNNRLRWIPVNNR